MIGLFNESAYGQMKLSNLKLGLYAQNLKIIVSNSPFADPFQKKTSQKKSLQFHLLEAQPQQITIINKYLCF